MKVLLVISDYRKGFPYIQDLERELKKENVHVNILDVENLSIINNDGSVSKIASSSTLNAVLQIPKVRTYTRIFILKRYLKKITGQFEAVGIHSCDSIYVSLIEDLASVSKNLSMAIWGSDFYRATDIMRKKKKRILDRCRYIIFGNPANAEDFINFYKQYNDKCIIVGFGVEKFETIRRLLKTETKQQIKAELQLPLDKVIVAVGYNGSEGQQHLAMIEELSTLPKSIKLKLFLLLQMTYGSKRTYEEQVEQKAAASGISYRILDSFLDDEETSKIRIATDIVLNAQITDGFSASLQEHICARNIVIVGDWLRYQPLEDANIFFIKASMSQFAKLTQDAVINYESYQASVFNNPDKIYRLSSWSNKIQTWIDVYGGTPGKVLRYAYTA